jgi:hypothetical protein
MKRLSIFAAFLMLTSCGGGSTVTSKSQPTAVAAGGSATTVAPGTTVGAAPATSTTSAKSSGKTAFPKPDVKAACTTILGALAPILATNALPTATMDSIGLQITGATPRGVNCSAKGAAEKYIGLYVTIATYGTEEFAKQYREETALTPDVVEVPGLGERALFYGSEGMRWSSGTLHAWRGREIYKIELKLADGAPKPSQQSLVEMMKALQALDVNALPLPGLVS